MHVHITGTHPHLREQVERLAEALRDRGDDVTFELDVSVGRRAAVEKVRRADALVCLLGSADGLREDATALGEWELDSAVDLKMPVVAYEAAVVDPAPVVPGLQGYSHTRLESLRRTIERISGLQSFHGPEDLVQRGLNDLERVRIRLRSVAPEAFRSIHRRLRANSGATYDAFAISMHNMDTLYWVHEIVPNSESPAKFLVRSPGGAGANTMVALSRLGLKTAVAGAVGNDAVGERLRVDLEDNKVDTSLVLTAEGYETGRGVVLRDRYHNYMSLIHGGANDHFVELLDQRSLREGVATTVQRSRIVHYPSFTGTSERNYQERLIRHLADETLLTFKPSTMHAVLGADRLEALLGRCDVLLASETELDQLFARSRDYRPDSPVSDRLDALFSWRHRHGSITPMIVVVYRGIRHIDQQDLVTMAWGGTTYEGAIGNDGSHRQHDDVLKDATGARDATAAGVLFGLLRGRTPVDCANLGAVLAMSVASEYGCRAGLPRSSQVRDCWRHFMRVHEPPRWLDPYG